MKAVIYTEGGTPYGMGHLSRCKALFDALDKSNHEVKIIVRGDANQMKSPLQGYAVEYTDWQESIDLLEDFAELKVVDSYTASLEHYDLIANSSQLALFLDDEQRLDYPKAVLLNPAVESPDPYKKSQSNNHKYLLGARYFLIQSLFREGSASRKEGTVLFSPGHTRNHEMSVFLLEALLRCPQVKKIDFVQPNNWIRKEQESPVLSLHQSLSPKQMSHLMKECSFMLCPAGQTSLEGVSTRTATIIYTTVPNQQANYKAIVDNGLALGIGSTDDSEFRTHALQALRKIHSPKQREELYKMQSEFRLELGADRIVQALENWMKNED